MKVILLAEDKVAEVAEGYARNYLLPKKLAVPATPNALVQMEKRAEKNRARHEADRQSAVALKEQIDQQTLTILADASEEGKLFGSVTTLEVAAALKDQLGIEIDKKKINLNEHIKTVGEHSATIKVHSDLNAHLKILVAKK
ncbi:50S ribosomal protein L9 [Candidatus Saganbacteria bacterium]|nr:50S ribosomal protein L9 [Candidatus Saganbacteria bacterium]